MLKWMDLSVRKASIGTSVDLGIRIRCVSDFPFHNTHRFYFNSGTITYALLSEALLEVLAYCSYQHEH